LCSYIRSSDVNVLKILIKNIKELVQVDDGTRIKVTGKDMAQLPTLKDAWLSVEDGKISDYGSMSDWNGVEDWTGLEVIDATDKLVLPSWCDSHTHLIFAGSREAEFVDRIKGLSYEEIAARGGGILNSAKKLQDTSEEELIKQTQVRLDEIASMGTGAVEIKSGYGLSTDAELKILRVAKKLKESSDLTIKSTFLGAHAIPAEYKDNRDGYLDLIVEEMLPIIKEEGLAEYIDVFCETNYFTVAEMERVMEAGTAHGLKPKVHVNQFTSIGGIEAAVRHKALSVDHLEIMEDKDIEAIVGSETMPTMLPSCSFFLSIPFGPARSLIERGLPVALATDYNPGSTASGNIPFVLSLACIKMRMTPEEAINAVTLNSAYAMDLSETHGSIAKGKVANLFITKEVPSYAYIPYSFGSNLVDTVILKGEIKSTNGKV